MSIAMSPQTVAENMERSLKSFLDKEPTDAEGKRMVKQLVRLLLIYISFLF
jgi:hypothetical protein